MRNKKTGCLFKHPVVVNCFGNLFDRLNQLLERFRIVHGHISKHLAIQLNTLYLQFIDKFRVSKTFFS